MVASRAFRLGWIAGLFLGQQLGRAFGQSTCTSITVSGVGDLDGTYEKGSSAFDPYSRAGGTTFYEIYPFTSSDVSGWYISVGNSVVYRVFDPAQHPADITLDWVECTGVLSCSAAAALLQPVITCEGETAVAPTPSDVVDTPSPSPGPSPGPSPLPTAAATEEPAADVTCGSDYACATATDTVVASALCETDPCSDGDCCESAPTCGSDYACATATDTVLADAVCSSGTCTDDECCEPRDTVAPVPSPIDNGSGDDNESPSPSPSPTKPDAVPDVSMAPVVSPPSSGSMSAPENDDDDDDGILTTELIAGVLSSLISAGILGAVGCVCQRHRAAAAAAPTTTPTAAPTTAAPPATAPARK